MLQEIHSIPNQNVHLKQKTAADSLSRLEMEPKEKIILKIREDIPTQPIEVNIESTGIAQEDLVLFDTTDQHETTEKEFGNLKKKQKMPYQTMHQSSVSCYCANDLDKDTKNVNISQLTKPSRIFIEQDSEHY